MSNAIRIVIALAAVVTVAAGGYYNVVRNQVEVKVELPPPPSPQNMSEEERLKVIKKAIGSARDLPPLQIPGGPPNKPDTAKSELPS